MEKRRVRKFLLAAPVFLKWSPHVLVWILLHLIWTWDQHSEYSRDPDLVFVSRSQTGMHSECVNHCSKESGFIQKCCEIAECLWAVYTQTMKRENNWQIN